MYSYTVTVLQSNREAITFSMQARSADDARWMAQRRVPEWSAIIVKGGKPV